MNNPLTDRRGATNNSDDRWLDTREHAARCTLQPAEAENKSGPSRMDSALYYTFSTIAQALAAALGLLAAFAMFRLKGIDDECRGAAETIDSMTGGGPDLRQHYLVAEWSKLLDEIDRRVTHLVGCNG